MKINKNNKNLINIFFFSFKKGKKFIKINKHRRRKKVQQKK